MNLLYILAFVAIALFVIVKLTEKTDKEKSMAMAAKAGRWIWPLVMLSLVLQLIYMMIK